MQYTIGSIGNRFGTALAALTLVLAAGCSSSSNNNGGPVGTGPACNIDAECARGQVCLGGKCGVQDCQALSDCGENQLCVTAASLGQTAQGSVCTGRECINDTDCNGGTCTSGLCQGGTNPQGCTKDDDCEADETCNTASGECEEKAPPTTPGICSACTEAADCEGGLECSKVGVSNHCVPTCSTKADCASGYECHQGHCVPGLFQCKGCLLDGCGEGQHCNATSGNCVDTPDPMGCNTCNTDGDCGDGMRCYGKEQTRYCVPDCSGGESCPANGACTDTEDGVKVCSWQTSGPCCFGEACGGGDPCDLCGGATPYCDTNKACVACTENSHCSDPTPLCDAGTCVEEGQIQCSGATPHYSESKGKCCECLNASHCNGLACDSVNCTCTETTGDVCDTCAEPYPACAEFEGQFVCVQCASDDDCTGTCNLETFSCDGNEVPATGNCVEEGCTPNTLSCDSTTGLCYAPDGNCDSVAQFCINGGTCHDLFAIITGCLGGGGGGGGLPIPGGGGIPGNCECEMGEGEIPGFGQGNCPDGLTCGPNGIALLFCGLAGGDTGPNVCQVPFN